MVKKPIDLAEVKPRFTVLLYGEPKVGKTTLAATAQYHPDMADVLFLDLDKRLASVVSTPGIKVISIDDGDDMEEVIADLISDSKNFDGIQTVVVDSLTKWLTREKEALGLEGFDRKRKGQHSRDELQIKDYAIVTSRITRLMSNLIDDERRHVILNAHKRVFYLDKNQTVVARRTFNANEALVNNIASMFNNIWVLQRDNGKIKMLTQPMKQYMSGTSGNRFPVQLGETIELVGSRDDNDDLILTPNLSDIFSLYLQSEYSIGE